jgi:hypothetical protein
MVHFLVGGGRQETRERKRENVGRGNGVALVEVKHKAHLSYRGVWKPRKWGC